MTTTPAIDEKSLIDTVWDLLDADADLNDDTKYLIIAALDSDEALAAQLDGDAAAPERATSETQATEPAGAFLRSIRVAGFRGIGAEATVEIPPYPGITIVSGRNGSGKSSFAEALEYALTGQSYRWKNKAKLWSDTWRNLHCPAPCNVQVDFTIEDGPATSIGADWGPEAQLGDANHWSQRTGEKRQSGVDALGWSTAIEIYRPILSYDEIGGLLEQEPSKLYDALAKLLALDEIQDAETRLNALHSERKAPRTHANAGLRQLKQLVGDSEDDRADNLGKLLRKRPPDIDVISTYATSRGDIESPLGRLQAIAAIEPCDTGRATAIATELRGALDEVRKLADQAIITAERRSKVLREALDFRTVAASDVECPVCGQGVLNGEWESHTRELLEEDDRLLADYRAATARVDEKAGDARDFLTRLSDVELIDGLHLDALITYRSAVDAAGKLPDNVEDLPRHLETIAPAVQSSLATLQAEIEAPLAAYQDAWAPVVASILEWSSAERTARQEDSSIEQLDAARRWVTENAHTLRNQRLEPIAEGARSIWAQLRQESNVELSEITLEGSRTRRKAVLTGSVDGEAAGALSVMSQGELHALALALFIPRATARMSPFRFVVLDDPIQAMDPAKIDGFLTVLQTVAEHRQVIVFSHDDRLATAVRQQPIPAHLLEVTRDTGSRVLVRPADDPAHRYVEDAFSVVADPNVPDEVKRRAVPGLFRFAIEAAARQVFFTRRNVAGAAQSEIETLWQDAKSVTACVALAREGRRDADISGWRNWREYRRAALQLATQGVHGGALTVTKEDVADLRKTVDDILSGT